MILEVNHVTFSYPGGPTILKNVTLSLKEGEVLVLFGPSGYGKSTLAQLISGFLTPKSGTILYQGKPLPQKGFRPVQLICQHPEDAVNPRWQMKDILWEPGPPDPEVLLEMGIQKKWYHRWPAEISGGELQRFCVARALRPETKVLICDEMTTMLDALNQAHIWNYVLHYARTRNISIIAITHNQFLAEKIADRIISLPDINHVDIQPEDL